ncbi:hypothetical protein AALP_AA3G356100 [Arabis alpina]|uniref:Rab-GAP TBC domain-containing protein n=1 Tax=Arabis alpina TaxID=50452 RepID=A0A087HDU0_ARAAL|nr:hypothetical protein AALP_AA3G356100 [Arabis alpina]
MSLSEIETAIPESSDCRFANLRGVRWRVNLGVLPSWSSSIDEFRRATADCRRRYALLRRRLLMDSYVLKDDNPLSQNPNSTWGQYFRNAELEKTLDQDLSRLYPEHWCYFQASGCQGMLRRILLLWCLKHPEYGYRQGMHELLAPLLYVLQVDIMRLSEVRKNYEDYFTDRFDSLSFEEKDITYTFGVNKFLDSVDDEIGSQGYSKKIKSLDELDPEVQCIVMLSDSYGAESELGIVLSEKFMEHDAYCMFDALMSGNHGCVAMAGFFGYSPASGSHTGLPPVLEACTAFYRLLAVVDSSLYSHLVELGVEPQYFGLRWLRVLFGREFLLQDLLLVWDEIFSADNNVRMNTEDSRNQSFRIFDCPRGTLIAGMAVSMMLYIRSSLLSTENATCCLQRLLNFPENIDLNKIIQMAKSLQALVMDTNTRSALSLNGVFDQSRSIPARTKSCPSGSTSPNSPLIIAPESYWEEKWREHKAEEEEKKIGLEIQSPPTQKKNKWLKLTKLFRAVTDLSHYKTGKRGANSSSFLEDLSQQRSPELEEANESNHLIDIDCPVTVSKEDDVPEETEEGIMDFHSADEESLISGDASSEENVSVSSEPTIIVRDSKDLENDSDSSTVSNLFLDENDKSVDSLSEENSSVSSEPTSPARDSNHIGNDSDCSTGSSLFADVNDKGQETSVVSPLSNEEDSTDASVCITKEHKFLPGIIQWLWKFRRSLSSEETSNGNASDATKTDGVESNKNQMGCSESQPQALSSGSNGDSDQNLMKTMKNLGQSMLEHIQVIESVFQQELGPAQAGFIGNLAKTSLIEKGQVTATTALKELRKISNLLSEM